MVFRALLGFCLVVMTLASGCSHCSKYVGVEPPPVTICHGARLANEIAWLYADINDVFLGIDYYPSMNSEFGKSPYAGLR